MDSNIVNDFPRRFDGPLNASKIQAGSLCYFAAARFGVRLLSSTNHHAVPVAKKPVPLFYRFQVRFQDKLTAGKCCNQHQECRFRKMEVGQQ